MRKERGILPPPNRPDEPSGRRVVDQGHSQVLPFRLGSPTSQKRSFLAWLHTGLLMWINNSLHGKMNESQPVVPCFDVSSWLKFQAPGTFPRLCDLPLIVAQETDA